MVAHGVLAIRFIVGPPQNALTPGIKGHVAVCRCGHQTAPTNSVANAYRLYSQHVREEWQIVNTFTTDKGQAEDRVLGSKSQLTVPAVSSSTAGGQSSWLKR